MMLTRRGLLNALSEAILMAGLSPLLGPALHTVQWKRPRITMDDELKRELRVYRDNCCLYRD